MLNPTLKQAYIPDETIRRILRTEDQKNWAQSELYERPLKRIERVKKKFSLPEILKYLFP